MFARCVVIFFGLAAVVRSEAEDCTREVLNRCTVHMNDEDEETPGIFPKEEFLIKNCGPLLDSLKCASDFTDRCPVSEIGNEAKVIRPVFELMTQLCDENSPIRKGYLDNVECYENNTLQVTFCAIGISMSVVAFQEQMKNRTGVHNEEIGACVGVPSLVTCVVDVIAENCGSEETSPLSHILNDISDRIVDNMCPADKMGIWVEEFSSYLEEDRKK